MPLEKTVMLVLRALLDPLVPLVREENRELLEVLVSKVFLVPRVPLVRPESLESRVCLEKLVPQEPLDLEVTEDSLVSVVPLAQLDLLVLVEVLVLLETMVLRVMLVPPVLPELRVPQDCRECLVSAVLVVFQD